MHSMIAYTNDAAIAHVINMYITTITIMRSLNHIFIAPTISGSNSARPPISKE